MKKLKIKNLFKNKKYIQIKNKIFLIKRTWRC